MGHTIVEKILVRATGRNGIKPGQIVNVPVDRLLMNDFVGPTAFKQFEKFSGKRIKHPERILFGMDHRVPPAEVKFADNLKYCRDKCRQYDVERFAEIGRHGIGHQLMVEHFTLPGEIALGTDSHATMYGGLGALACGITASDAAAIMLTGEIWLLVPHSLRIDIQGKLGRGVTSKDVSLKILTLDPIQNFIYRAIEFSGEYIADTSVADRLVIANMMAELDAKCAIVPADKKTAAFVGIPVQEMWQERPDPDAVYEKMYEIDVSKMEPMLACPHSVDNVHPIREVEGTPIHQAFLGSCTNGRIEDMEQALEILKGKKVHPDVRLIVVPASQSVMLEATKRGLVEQFLEVGAAVMTPSCASCAGGGPGLIGAGERCVSTTNRNFKGRMGSPDSEVYLASPYVVAAAAVTGKLTDPRTLL